MRNLKPMVGTLACVFFLITAIGLFKGFPVWLIVILFLLHSLCLMFLAFIFSTERTNEEEELEKERELSDLREQVENEKNLMKKALDAREGELNEKIAELNRLKDDVAQKDEALSNLKNEVKTAKEELSGLKGVGNEFLPPATDKPVSASSQPSAKSAEAGPVTDRDVQ